jgi:hypothetical protein
MYTGAQDLGTRAGTAFLPIPKRDALRNAYGIKNRTDRGIDLDEVQQAKILPVAGSESITGADLAKMDPFARDAAVDATALLARSNAGLAGALGQGPVATPRNLMLKAPVGTPAAIAALSAYPAYQVGKTLIDTLSAPNPAVPSLKTQTENK